jgi:hypothetical protein
MGFILRLPRVYQKNRYKLLLITLEKFGMYSFTCSMKAGEIASLYAAEQKKD